GQAPNNSIRGIDARVTPPGKVMTPEVGGAGKAGKPRLPASASDQGQFGRADHGKAGPAPRRETLPLPSRGPLRAAVAAFAAARRSAAGRRVPAHWRWRML